MNTMDELGDSKLYHLHQHGFIRFIHHGLLAVLLAILLLNQLDPAHTTILYLWLLLLFVSQALQFRHSRQQLRQNSRVLASRSYRPEVSYAALSGISWGAISVFLPFVNHESRFLIILVLFVLITSALPHKGVIPAVIGGYAAGIMLPLLLSLSLLFGFQHDWVTIFIISILVLNLFFSAYRLHAILNKLYENLQKLQNEASHDKLTALLNRRSFDRLLLHEWHQAQRMAVPLSLIVIDVDHFKKYNDRFGHQAGDVCLSKIAQALTLSLYRNNDLVARYGGEEFVVILFHTSRDEARKIAERIRHAILNLQIPHPDSPVGIVSVSLGGATCIPNQEQTPKNLLIQADTALYTAKNQGRNQVAWAHCE